MSTGTGVIAITVILLIELCVVIVVKYFDR